MPRQEPGSCVAPVVICGLEQRLYSAGWAGPELVRY